MAATQQRPLRVGLAGAGMIAHVHADAVRRAGGVVAGVAASAPDRAERAAASIGAERAYASAEELAADPGLDVVHVCTPNALHHPLTELAVRTGHHVVCEKPLATSAADAAELERIARTAGVVAAVPFVYRYHPMAAEARARTRSGGVGDVRLVHGHYLQDWLAGARDTNWRVDAALGGPSRAFADIGSHWCDLVEWVTGHRIAELTADLRTVHARRPDTTAATFSGEAPEGGPTVEVTTEDAATLLFRTDLGATGTLVISQVSPGRKNRLWFEVDGADASLAFDQENPESLFVGGVRTSAIAVRDPGTLSPEAARLSPLPPGHPMGYADCFAAFVADVYAGIRDGADAADPPPYPTFADAVRQARLTEAVLDSARSRTWTAVPETEVSA